MIKFKECNWHIITERVRENGDLDSRSGHTMPVRLHPEWTTESWMDQLSRKLEKGVDSKQLEMIVSTK